MATQFRQRVYDAPVHVSVGADGAVRIYLPDGGSISLSPDAAVRSGAMLSRAVAGSRNLRRRRGECAANVITANFAGHARSA